MRQGERTDLEPSLNWGKVSQSAAAELLSVGTASVERAKAIQKYGTPELQRAVEAGEVKVSTAAVVASLPDDAALTSLPGSVHHSARTQRSRLPRWALALVMRGRCALPRQPAARA